MIITPSFYIKFGYNFPNLDKLRKNSPIPGNQKRSENLKP